MSDRLNELYQEVIVKYSKNPSNFSRQTDKPHVVEAYNPVCGDQFNLYFDIDGQKIANLSFHGYGCAISKASTSVLTELVVDLSIEEFQSLKQSFTDILSDKIPDEDLIEPLKAFLPVKNYPGRIKCVTLGWQSLDEYLSSLE